MRTYLLLATALVTLAGCDKAGSGGNQTAASATKTATASVPASPPALMIQPGNWENRVEILDVQMANGPPGLAAAMKARPQIVTHCVTAEDAAKGPSMAMNADKACHFNQVSMENGQISTELTCARPSGTMTISSRGSYTPTSYSVTGHATMTGQMGMSMTTRTSGHRLGDCS